MLFLSSKKIQSHPNYPIELRVDLLDDREKIEPLPQPVLLTMRGGREEELRKLLNLEPEYFDLEWHHTEALIQEYPKTKFLISYHNFEETPKDLKSIYQKMQKKNAWGYKIACMAHSTNDALRMLLFGREHPDLSVISMGEKGKFARILGKVCGNQVNFACYSAEEKIAPGQLTREEMHFERLNQETAIYGLIGDPVEQSIGHLYHNRVFQERGINAVYVKMSVTKEELPEFIPLAVKLGIKGLSVTMPLKEALFPYPINTLKFENSQISALNTDGTGALDAIEKRIPVQNKKIVLLGTGGTAKAIAEEAKKRAAQVILLSRTEMAHLPPYDILVNCTPVMPIEPHQIQPRTLVMDVVYNPKETDFLKEANLRECEIIYGDEMFFNQAARQTAFWL